MQQHCRDSTRKLQVSFCPSLVGNVRGLQGPGQPQQRIILKNSMNALYLQKFQFRKKADQIHIAHQEYINYTTEDGFYKHDHLARSGLALTTRGFSRSLIVEPAGWHAAGKVKKLWKKKALHKLHMATRLSHAGNLQRQSCKVYVAWTLRGSDDAG